LLVTTGGGGWLMTEAEYTDFFLSLEYRIQKGGNSGIALRAPLKGDPAYQGMEIQIIDNASYPRLKPAHETGAIYDAVGPIKRAPKPPGQWNQLSILAKGRTVGVMLNGTVILRVNLDDFRGDAAKHPGLLRRGGHIGLQSHTGRVEFRKIGLRRLDAKEVPAPGAVGLAPGGYGQPLKPTVEQLQEAAGKGDAKAQTDLAYRLWNGDGV